MKIKIEQCKNHWCYMNESHYTPEQFDYIFKYLYSDKLDENYRIFIYDKEVKKWFSKLYTDGYWSDCVYFNSSEQHQQLKDCHYKNKEIFLTGVVYFDKQKLKTIVNRIINIALKKIYNNSINKKTNIE